MGLLKSLANFAGRRGEIVWKSNVAGIGGRRDYDAHQAFGVIVPLLVFKPVHTFGWGQYGSGAQAIRLREDRGFRLRAYLSDWCALLFIVTVGASPLFGVIAYMKWIEQKSSWIGFSIGAVLATILLVASVVILFRLRRIDRRERDIRLLLGTHAWGSSDPAYWNEELLADLIAPDAFGASTFAEMARESLVAKKWCLAMWGARLCAAVEDIELGEEITSEILAANEVHEPLRRIRKKPHLRDEELGPPPPLGTWVAGDLEQPIFAVSG